MNDSTLYINTVRKLKNGKNDSLIESIISGFKAIQLEATGICPCGDPNCDGTCKQDDTQESTDASKTSYEKMEAFRGNQDLAAFVESTAKMIAESAYSDEDKSKMVDGLEKYIHDYTNH